MKVNRPLKKPLTPQQQMQKLDQKLKQGAKMYEKHFLRQMVKAMRNSVSHSALTKPGMAENIYREQLDDQYVDNWMDVGGTGFADVIYKDLINKFYPHMNKVKRNIKPLPVAQNISQMKKVSSPNDPEKQTFNFMLKSNPGKNYLQLPWQGKFEKAFQMEGGQKVAMFSHPFGLKSTFVFQGQMEPGLMNEDLKAGDSFALLSPESASMTWQVSRGHPAESPVDGEKR